MKPTRSISCMSLGILLLLVLAARGPRAQAEPAPPAEPASRVRDAEFPAIRGEPGSASSTNTAQPPREPEGILTLDRALELALAHSLDLAASSHRVQAAAGEARQAGAWPNPELEITAEEFGGSDSRQGYEGAKTTVWLSQAVELGGTRSRRQHLAQAEARLAGWDHEAKRRTVLAQTRKAFVDVLLAQGRLVLAESLRALAEDVRLVAAERVKAGKVPPLEETKAGVEAAAARIARDRARRELDTARRRLAASWAGTTPLFAEAVGNLDALGEVPPLPVLAASLDLAPELARGTDEAARGQAALALARAARLPTPVISAGLSRFEEDGTYAGSAGLSLPLPLFDRNAGAILAATHHAAGADYDQRAARLRALTDLTDAHSRLETARAEALTVTTDLLPGAQQALEAAQAGYREGKLGLWDVLDAQRTFSEAKAHYLDSLAAYHHAAADTEHLTGMSLNTLTENNRGGRP